MDSAKGGVVLNKSQVKISFKNGGGVEDQPNGIQKKINQSPYFLNWRAKKGLAGRGSGTTFLSKKKKGPYPSG